MTHAANILTTEDGYLFEQLPNGWFTDGDVEFDANNTDIFGLVWQAVDGIYCADGDGLVVVSPRGDGFVVGDQGDHVSSHATLREALFVAQAVLAANYPAVYESSIE